MQYASASKNGSCSPIETAQGCQIEMRKAVFYLRIAGLEVFRGLVVVVVVVGIVVVTVLKLSC